MKIRKLDDNLETIRKISTWIYNEWAYKNKKITIELIMRDFVKQENELNLTLIAYEKENAIGMARLVHNDMKKKNHNFHPWLSSVYVDETYRGKSIATELCKAVIKEAKNLGYKKVYLYTTNSKILYEKIGWNMILEDRYNNEDVVIMSIDL